MIHLHTRSRYSLLEGVDDIDDILEHAKNSGQSAAVLSDHRSMFATMKFLKAAEKEGIKPVIALEFEALWQEKPYSFLLLALDSQGLQNLYRLSTRLMSDSQPLLAEEISFFSPHCILLNAGGDDLLAAMCIPERNEQLMDFLQMMKQSADENSVYVAMSLHDSPFFRQRDVLLKEAARAADLPTTAVSRIEYGTPRQEQTLRLLQAIAAQKTIDHPDLCVRSGRYWRSEEEMMDLYDEEDLHSTDEIIERVEEYHPGKAELPQFVNRAGISSEEYLQALCHAGLKKRLGARIPAQYLSRLDYELHVIVSMGFANYFLIVYDFIREARSRQILVGPGRGSAAGSLVSWVLGISHVDPVANGLLFERFLNPERISMPDIDTDFPDSRRDEMIEYVQSLYGKNHVAHIVTFSRMKARAALRDAAKALGAGIRGAERLTEHIPAGSSLTLDEAYKTSRAFASLVDNSSSLRRIFEAAKSIENFPRHASTHAGGIVLAKEEITAQAPLWDAGSEVPATQFSMDYLEDIGLIKFDFLALRNLSMIDAICTLIQEQTGRDTDLLRLDLHDPGVYELLRRADTLGVFQLESPGIRRLLLRFRPERFEDIAAVLALYRPGPMKSIDTYLQARFHPQSRQSIHPLIDPLLAETGGIFLYQEQIMEAARILGGFSLSQADILRKAMSKKKREVMEEWKVRFTQGAAEKGIEPAQAEQIFSIMEEFADYGFNKSHSYAYGLVVYWMAWLKVHYPAPFYSVMLEYTQGSSSKTAAFLQEARRRQIALLPVSINHSGTHYQIVHNALQIPLSQLKALSRRDVQKIIQEREEHGPFTDPVMTILRLTRLKLNSRQIMALIQTGAMDELTDSREGLESAADEIMRMEDLALLDEQSGEWTLSGVTPPQIPRLPRQAMKRLMDEKEQLGFSLAAHPATQIRRQDRSLVSIEQAQKMQGSLKLCGLIRSVREHKTKKGDLMAFATLEDDTSSIDLAIMPRTWSACKGHVKEGSFVIASGKKDRENSAAVFEIRPLQIS